MNVEKFWITLNYLNEEIKDEEYWEIFENWIAHETGENPFEVTYERYNRVLKENCDSPKDIQTFIAIYDFYYEILNQKYFKELQGKNSIVDIAEDTYYIFITYLITLGENILKTLYNSSSKEILPYINSYKHNGKCCNIHDYFKSLKCQNWLFGKNKQGESVYNKFELSIEVKNEIEKRLVN